MRAVVQSRYGSPSELQIVERAEPSLGAGQVRIRVTATPVTQGDRRLRSGEFGTLLAIPGRLMMGLIGPRTEVPGSMYAGVVEAVGDGVDRFQVGDRVFGCSMGGALAEVLVVPADGAIAHTPDAIDDVAAAATPYGCGTAWHFLTEVGEVGAGTRVLILGASGGVGRFAVQLARHLGAEVTGVCSGRDRAMVEDLGAHHVVDYTTQDVADLPGRFDVIFDTSGRHSLSALRGILAADGRFMTLEVEARFVWDALLASVSSGPKAMSAVVMSDREGIERIARLLADGTVRPTIGAQYDLDSVREAHEVVEARAVKGDIVVRVAA